MNFLSYLINGISLGSVYAIIALGYTMVYGIAKMLNFAHGDVIMVGCYIVFMTMSGQGWGAIPAVVLSIIVCTLLCIVIEKIAYKPLRKATPLAVLITAIGVSYFLENAALLIFGADTRSFTNVVTLPALKLAGGALTISSTTIVTFLACVVIMAALMLFIKKTKAGQAMLAVSEDKDAAQLMGVNVNATISLTFAIGSGLAAVAGVLFCSAYPTLTPYTGAGLDVLCKEPMDPENPLLKIQDSNKLIITPHIAWAAKETRFRVVDEVVKNIQRFQRDDRTNRVY